jgi:hypothetical protein
MKSRTIALAIAGMAAACPMVAQAQISASIGFDYAEGKYGTPDKTSSVTIPVSIKYESGPWTFRASLPYMSTNGTFSRDQGTTTIDCRRSGSECTTTTTTTTTVAKRTEAGMGDLTLGVFRNIVETKGGLLVDLGVKAKLATADEKKTLITTGENDYSVQADVFQSLTRDFSLLGTLGIMKKGDTDTLDYRDPVFVSLGASLALGGGGSVGAAWDFRQKTTPNGDPISEVSLYYTAKFSADRKLNLYVLTGLADGSPDFGGGIVFSQRF